MKRRSAVWVTLGALAAATWGCGSDSESTGSSSRTPLSPASDAPATETPATDPAAPGAAAPPAAAGTAEDTADDAEVVPSPSGGLKAPASEPGAGAGDLGAALAAALEAAVARGDAPGVVGLVVDREGVLFEGAAGQLDVANAVAMPVDAIFNIASMTKPVTSVAVMMLFERGLLDLDDPVSEFLPGFDALEVLTSDPAVAIETVPATTPMTVRHLLSHTSGIGYSFANRAVAQMQAALSVNELELPLLNEPGSRWNYGASTRVLGLIVEELTDEPLADFFDAEIFEPLGMLDTSYAVPTEKQPRLPTLHVRGANGNLQEGPQNAPAVPAPPFNGDGGLYSTARDYGLFMRMFLNGGALGEARILSESSVQLMGENQIGASFVELQDGGNPGLSLPFPLGAGVDKFGLGFQITGSDGAGVARSAGSLAWAGLFNTEFWIDAQHGVAATLLMQVLPFYDEGALRALSEFESAVYRGLPAAADQ